jgi:hypothetical protein
MATLGVNNLYSRTPKSLRKNGPSAAIAATQVRVPEGVVHVNQCGRAEVLREVWSQLSRKSGSLSANRATLAESGARNVSS